MKDKAPDIVKKSVKITFYLMTGFVLMWLVTEALMWLSNFAPLAASFLTFGIIVFVIVFVVMWVVECVKDW